MPIKGLSDHLRLVRRGKIRLGEKKISDSGKEYPVSLDYFVCPLEVQEIYGEQPKKLDIMFPLENQENFFPQFYKCYGRTKGLVCKGDGESALRLSEETGKMEEVKCEGRDCPQFQNKQCRAVGSLQVILPKVKGLGIYQIDTSSYNSIVNLNSSIEMIRGMLGKVSWIPLVLEVKIEEAHPMVNGSRIKTKIPIMSVTCEKTVPELIKIRQQFSTGLPTPVIQNRNIDEKEPLLYPPADKVIKTEEKKEDRADIPKTSEAPEIEKVSIRGNEIDTDSQVQIGDRGGIPEGERIKKEKERKELVIRIHDIKNNLENHEIWKKEDYVNFLEEKFGTLSTKNLSIDRLYQVIGQMSEIFNKREKS